MGPDAPDDATEPDIDDDAEVDPTVGTRVDESPPAADPSRAGDAPTGDLAAAVDEAPYGAAPAAEVEPEVDEEAVARFEQRRRTIRTVVDVVVVGVCVAFALWHLQPHLLLRDTTPAGGDMGAHVWGPAYLRDHLIPNGQLAGWSGAWYAGFPAYQFYMVVPSLMIVGLNAGFHGWAALIPAAVGLGGLAVAVARWHDRRTRRWALLVAVVGLALVGLPYGVAFKLITVSGVATLPISAYALGRLAGAKFPSPAVLSVATLPFLFYRGFTIYGGNIPSTLAGEFAFSISLSLALLYLGVVFKGLETGRYRALAALLLALTGLCHIIPAFWAIGATVVAIAVRFNFTRSRLDTGFPVLIGGLGAVLVGAGASYALGGAGATVGVGIAAIGALALVVGLWLVSDSVRWIFPVGVVAGLLGAWWVGPFYLRTDYLNDMGWEKLPYQVEEKTRLAEWMQHLLPSETADVDLRWIFGLAVLGAALTIVLKMRLGIFLALTTVGVGVVFVRIPEGRLWNGRLLPFYYLTTMLLAALAVTELARAITMLVRDRRPAPAGAGVPVALGALAAVIVVVGVPLGQLPLTEKIENGYTWPRFSPVQMRAEPASFIPSWARWNYSGYEGKESYREYYDIVSRMREVGEQEGCGRAFWEYEKELDRYGTPMALMLLPHWTDGCIGSMEGLYFEASATTPFHFLTQVELSTAPSAAQRDLPYGGFDVTKGVDHLQMMGVKYYMATSDNAIAQARTNPELTEVASSGPWVVFEVADSEIVSPLENQPAVVVGIDDSQLSWVEEPHDESGRFGGPAVSWFTDPQQWAVPLASSGPVEWQRVEVGEGPETQPLDPVEVSNVDIGEESISFDVDEVGVPVVVKVSYFPNWQVSGADGPYRVAPNFMVVVPTETHVELTYGRTPVEYASYTATLLGIVGLILLARRPQMAFSGRGARRRDEGDPYEGEGDPYEGEGFADGVADQGDPTGEADGVNGDGGEADQEAPD